MNIQINGRECQANIGDRLLDVARASHSHIGYFCGGNSICQTCYVKVLEGQELLSPLSDAEKAILSENLIREGTRMACLTHIEKPGNIRLVSMVEEIKRMAETNPLQLPAYAGTMGWEATVKLGDTLDMQWHRESTTPIDPWQLFLDVISGIGDALQLVFDAVQSALMPKSCCEDMDKNKCTITDLMTAATACCKAANGKQLSAVVDLPDNKSSAA